MCFLSFVPHGAGHFSITHNRDEHRSRPKARPPETHFFGEKKAVFPTDPTGGGTWFAASDDWVLAILNGGFERHERKKTGYRTSRGSVILDFLRADGFERFEKTFDPRGLEPFTLVVFDQKKGDLRQFVWDEKAFHARSLGAEKARFWSSATLYDSNIRDARARLFSDFLIEKPSPQAVFEFQLLEAATDGSVGFFVHLPNGVETVSTIQATGRAGEMKLRFESWAEEPALFV